MGATVIPFRYHENKTEASKTGVITKPGSKKLYVDIRPNGVRVQKTSGLDDTPENRATLQKWVDRQNERIKNGTFKFSEAFPKAPEKEKSRHALLEGREYQLDTQGIIFGEYAERWAKKNFKLFPPSRMRSYKSIIEYRIMPFFKDMTFRQINGVVLKDFISTLRWKEGPKKGDTLSASRVSNILIVLRAIWNDAVEEHQWERPDPFSFIKRFLRKDLKTRPQKGDPQVFRFGEWEKVVKNIHPHHRPVTEFMIMTGMIGSEIAGLKKSAIKDDRICVNNSIVRGHEKAQLKTEYRRRDIPMTEALSGIINSVISRSDSEYLFTTRNGRVFDVDSFRKNAWTTALKRSGIPYRVPYSTRHTFAAWALTLKMDPNKLVNLMGHGSKKMVYEVYGKYVEGLETDEGKILTYFGNDFDGLKIKKASPFT